MGHQLLKMASERIYNRQMSEINVRISLTNAPKINLNLKILLLYYLKWIRRCSRRDRVNRMHHFRLNYKLENI